jgi:uncharacterized membrane protein YecN with MAPEG domain
VLDELPSLELAATAVALVLVLRAASLSGGGAGLLRRTRRVESGRARDLVGIAIIVGAMVYAIRVERASTWFLAACGLAVVAQLVGFYFRNVKQAHATAAASAQPALGTPGNGEDTDDEEEDDDANGCPNCGHATLIELDDTTRLLGGLSALTPVTAAVCPQCGALSGHVEDPAKIPLGDAHGTRLSKSPSGDDAEALQDPTEHDG